MLFWFRFRFRSCLEELTRGNRSVVFLFAVAYRISTENNNSRLAPSRPPACHGPPWPPFRIWASPAPPKSDQSCFPLNYTWLHQIFKRLEPAINTYVVRGGGAASDTSGHFWDIRCHKQNGCQPKQWKTTISKLLIKYFTREMNDKVM